MTADPARVVAKCLFGFAALLSVFGSLNPPTPKPQTPTPVVITPTPQAPVAMVATPPVQVVEAPQVVAVVATPTPTPIEVARPTTAPPKVVATPAPVVMSGTHEDWMRAAGIAESDWTYVEFIMNHESGGNPRSINKSSGSCGLFQQLPCGKWSHQWDDPIGAMTDASAYAKSRYGSWYGAYQFWLQKHWW